jgi:NAD(P) transhydrogenase subunit alpha
VKIAVARETKDGESRVAMVPELVEKLTALGYDVAVEPDAGRHALLADDDYTQAGASVVADAFDGADVVVSVQPLAPEQVRRLPRGTSTISFLPVSTEQHLVADLRDAGVTAYAMELVPRISRAQSMDALSSQATVGGYLAVLIAATEIPRFFPMLMTAAGTIPPAQVLVLGAGVAGLQAIATSRRLGAVVTAFDVRSAVKEQIQSLGARFFEVEGIGEAEAAGGYARELTPEEQDIQRQALAVQMGKSDVIVTTALVPGRPAPKLVSADAVAGMRPGSVIVDMAGEAGGNCELSRPGETFTTDNGVIIAAPLNLPSRMAEHASQLYAKNVQALLELMTDKESKALRLDFDDEIIAGACITRGGEIVHEGARSAAGGGRGGEASGRDRAAGADAPASASGSTQPRG